MTSNISTLVICENVDEIRRALFLNPRSINELDIATKWSPLMTAIFYEKPEVARFLISRGADLSYMTYSRSSLTFAFSNFSSNVFMEHLNFEVICQISSVKF